ncbi:hypothetical protein GGU10DRAFT_355280 [Lentinula aff. detonsa]|uniref:Glycoside hydrolase family 2 catalytic domain-containing protein n=1 Tax=Lentinula aff. detonsa TaxID=2804958 RepID=A0AA38L4E5_9AGAR|nr:hypothetical protein GGU10DRAFT_355280 [Lentinula aff. detonsa]
MFYLLKLQCYLSAGCRMAWAFSLPLPHSTPPCVMLLPVKHGVYAQTWCGKNYMITEPVTNPGGQFPPSLAFTEPHLALRCGPAVKPYLPEDVDSHSTDPTFTSILVDTPVTFTNITGATPFNHVPSIDISTLNLDVTVLLDSQILTSGSVPLNGSKHALPFSLSTLKPRTEAYNLTCLGSLSTGEQVLGSSLLTYLPEKPTGIGSVTKMDMRSGALLAKPPTGEDGPYEPVFPIGFYTQYGSYLATNLSIPSVLKEQGFTVVHPVPDFDNITVLDEVLDKMQEVGLWLMYDMRNTYQNSTSVTEQVNHIKSRPNLLLWYTADEPDGTSDPLNATTLTKNLINTLDGGDGQGGAGYHPVSLVLNCENYFWSEYSNGADILLQDTYMIGNNVTFSNQWGTPCTADYGDCGCDNCKGSFEDISTRMDEFYERALIDGWELEKAVWTVPQGFGNETYWTRYPTGEEWVVQSIVGINHGGLGVVSWDDPTPDDIKASASALAKALTSGSSPLAAFILDPSSTFRQVTTQRGIDTGLWTLNDTTLLLVANMNYENTTLDATELDLREGFGGHLMEVFCSGACQVGSNGIVFGSVASGAFIFGV